MQEMIILSFCFVDVNILMLEMNYFDNLIKQCLMMMISLYYHRVLIVCSEKLPTVGSTRRLLIDHLQKNKDRNMLLNS